MRSISKYMNNHRQPINGLGVVAMLAFFPTMAFAAPGTFKEILFIFIDFLNSAVTFMMVLSLLAFIWGVTKFIATAGDDKSRAEGKHLMVWGTLALFFMVSIWGIVRIIKLSFFGAA